MKFDETFKVLLSGLVFVITDRCCAHGKTYRRGSSLGCYEKL